MFERIPLLLLAMIIFGTSHLEAQEGNAPKVILITMDGLRWQEMFSGADPLLIGNKEYVQDTTELMQQFWRETANERRASLMPFIWTEVAKMGQIHGNRNLGSKVNLTNSMWFSYPGYNEILSGRADDVNITSNDKINNPNTTVLEVANKNVKYRAKVAAFASWDVFPFIVNEERSGVPVNAGFEDAIGAVLTEREKFLNQLQRQVPSPWASVRLDAFTHHYALEYSKKNHPALLYIAYGETDDFAHDGNYAAYLKSAHTTDDFIRELWDFTQQDPFYKDQTVFLITTDHGRGTDPLETWTGHGKEVRNAGDVWLIAFGKGVKPMGEIRLEEQLHSDQIAPTILKWLGIDLETPNNMGLPMPILEK